MSLFKAREWWRTKCGDGEEEFDTACIAVGDVLNTNTGDAQIVTGSLNGVLRIHQPHSSSSNSGTTSGGGSVGVGAEGVGAQSKSATSAAGIGSGQYSIEDLLYERNFGEPILGVRTGQFTSQGHVVLALLFSRRLSVYRVSRNGGGIDASGHMGMLNTNNAASTTAIDASSSGHTAHAAASFYTLSVCYEHQLDRNAYSMCTGQFGGAYTFTYIAVQSLDGAISVFENESLAYTRFIPGFLLPGPLAYCLSTDAIVTANSNFEVQSFKCATLTAANAAGGAANNAANAARRSLPEHEHGHVRERDAAAAASMSGTAGPLTHHQPRVKEDWKVVIGELALDIQVGKVLGASTASSSAAEDVVVLGEQTLFVLSADAGRIKMQRRLDYLPVCMHLYRVEDPLHHNRSMHADRAVSSMSSESAHGAFCNILVGSSTGVILIYRELDLIWSAKCDFVNVSLSVARIGGVSGLIVGLGDAGQLDVNFIGTDPPTNGAMNAAAAVGIDADGRGSADDEMEYEQMDNEHRQLLAKIRERCSSNNANGIGGAAASTDTLEKVVIRAQVPSCLDSAASRKRTAGVSEYHHNDALDGFDAAASVYSGRSVTIRLYVSGTGTGRRSIEDLSLLLSVAEPFFIVGEKRVHVGRVPNSSANDAASSSAAPAASLSFTVGIDETPGRDMLLPGDTEVTVTAQYAVVGSSSSSAGGSTTGVETIKVQLPLCLSVDAIPPVKADGFKITLETNRQPPLLAVLFDDIIPTSSSTASGAAVAPGGRGVGELSAAAMEAAATSEMAAMHEMHAMNASIFGNAITLRYLNGIEVTVLVSKNAGRYRVQSACFEAMWLAVNELQRRLSMFFIDSSASSSSTSSGPFCISFGEPLPLQDYFALIDRYGSHRCWLAGGELRRFPFTSTRATLELSSTHCIECTHCVNCVTASALRCAHRRDLFLG